MTTAYLKGGPCPDNFGGHAWDRCWSAVYNPEIRSLMEEYFKVIGMFMGALGGLFVLGFATRRANGRGAMVGYFVQCAIMVVVWLTRMGKRLHICHYRNFELFPDWLSGKPDIAISA